METTAEVVPQAMLLILWAPGIETVRIEILENTESLEDPEAARAIFPMRVLPSDQQKDRAIKVIPKVLIIVDLRIARKKGGVL